MSIYQYYRLSEAAATATAAETPTMSINYPIYYWAEQHTLNLFESIVSSVFCSRKTFRCTIWLIWVEAHVGHMQMMNFDRVRYLMRRGCTRWWFCIAITNLSHRSALNRSYGHWSIIMMNIFASRIWDLILRRLRGSNLEAVESIHSFIE